MIGFLIPSPVYVPLLELADAWGLRSDTRCHLAVGWVELRKKADFVLDPR